MMQADEFQMTLQNAISVELDYQYKQLIELGVEPAEAKAAVLEALKDAASEIELWHRF